MKKNQNLQRGGKQQVIFSKTDGEREHLGIEKVSFFS